MGTRGPVGKRDAERRRRNDVGTTSFEVTDEMAEEIVEGTWADDLDVEIENGIPLPDVSWHRVAKLFYAALFGSPQSKLYSPSDWALAYLMCENLSRDLKPRPMMVDGHAVVDEDGNPRYVTSPINGASMGAYLKAMNDLLVTEAARLRVRLELNWPLDKGKPKAAGGNVVEITSAADRKNALLG